MSIYMKYEGTAQGWIKGDSKAHAWADFIALTSVEFGMGHPYDSQTSMITGKQVVRPLVLTKGVDKATPLLMTSSCTNEVGKTVKISYTRTGVEGKVNTFFTIELTNALVQDFKHHAAEDGSAIETLHLTFQKIEITWTDGGLTAITDVSSK